MASSAATRASDVDDLRDELADRVVVVAHAGHGEVPPHQRPVRPHIALEKPVRRDPAGQHVIDQAEVDLKVVGGG